MSDSFDVAVVGGGMVGASLCVALRSLAIRVALIEAVPHDSAAQPSFDERTTALSNGSRRILETLELWPAIRAATTPIAKIHISDRGRFGFARIEAREQGLEAMGYVVPNRALGDALWSRLANSDRLRVFCPAEVSRIEARADAVELEVSERDRGVARLTARLVVAADGARSAVRDTFGVRASVRDYEQTAVITTVLPQRFHEHVAYERFTPS